METGAATSYRVCAPLPHRGSVRLVSSHTPIGHTTVEGSPKRVAESRRGLLSRMGVLNVGLLVNLNTAWPVEAAKDDDLLVEGVVTLDNGVVPLLTDRTALYLTVRPGGRRTALNRSPPLAGVRISISEEDVTFPYKFAVRMNDVYPDAPPRSEWESQGLTVSARLDTDGTAATRDPEDLVGRGEADLVKGNRKPAEVVLMGRGFGGKLITQKSG